VAFGLSLLLQAINKKKEEEVDTGGFYPTPPESIGEQSQGTVFALHLVCILIAIV
jgi:hypothetical protein